ncbi:PucR family transcriptional regulator [Pseudalkalibacillus berkeleyi]|uniref:Helix-turn-helix domain-containing protein n=1 Tax=Pseudalkalibacillus berkeleyi TaxID=1069813 RepID=A0ABS9GXF0_9BACL|nr:helix-turn-helix domain-containing protein [Pseudalkalibacillus berkeleyi]MCF6136148.1 helix-turn-helix domain-containing protein [Pseudalkalibacillus berkeleyi]
MSEIHKLRTLFGQEHIIEDTDEKNREDFLWYRTAKGEEFGVNKAFLTTESEQLLQVFLTPLADRPTEEDEIQQAWYELLFNNRTSDHYQIQQGRLLHFQINSKDIEHDLFVEAFQNMLSNKLIPVWKDRYSGVFVEGVREPFATTNELNELLLTIESDFYMNASLFIGSPFSSITEAKSSFDIESSYYDLIAKPTQRINIFSLTSVLPTLLLHQSRNEDIEYYQDQIIGKVEPELLNTVKVLLDCDLNLTAASKKLFIHRNSLQYRLEKFTDLTGLDPKTFKDAITCHLLLLSQEI